MGNKGMTLIELLIGFLVTSAIVVSMFNFILDFSGDEQNLKKKIDIRTYKNIVTKLIQTDIIKNELKSVSVSSNGNNYDFLLTFNTPFENTGITTKNLIVHASSNNKDDNFIVYDDINNLGQKQKVRYDLPNTSCTGSKCRAGSSTDSDFTRFSSIGTNIHDVYNTIDPITQTNYGVNYFSLDIAISSPEEVGDNHILIVAPLNYRYCKITDKDEEYYSN